MPVTKRRSNSNKNFKNKKSKNSKSRKQHKTRKYKFQIGGSKSTSQQRKGYEPIIEPMYRDNNSTPTTNPTNSTNPTTNNTTNVEKLKTDRLEAERKEEEMYAKLANELKERERNEKRLFRLRQEERRLANLELAARNLEKEKKKEFRVGYGYGNGNVIKVYGSNGKLKNPRSMRSSN